MAYRQDFPKHGLIGIWNLAINKSTCTICWDSKSHLPLLFSVSFLCFMQTNWRCTVLHALKHVKLCWPAPKLPFQTSQIKCTWLNEWPFMESDSYLQPIFPHIVLPQSPKQIQRSSCCGSMDARHAVTSTCMWQYAVALNVRFYPNAILSQYSVTICLGP